MLEVTYRTNGDAVDWSEMKRILQQDSFDNGRSAEQLETSFNNSYAFCVATVENRIVGTARVLSDGICNAYLVDVWTLSKFRHQGIASTMIQMLLSKLSGQHVYLQTDDAQELYRKLGFTEQPTGMSKVVGKWLENEEPERGA